MDNLIRSKLFSLKPYEPIDPVEVLAERAGIPASRVIKLDGNENPYGCSPRVQQALAEDNGYHIYPDPLNRELRRLVAEYAGCSEECVAVGSGSDELIDLVLRVTLEPGDRVINCPPTFGMYPFSTEVCGGEVISVPRGADFEVDVAAVKSAIDERSRVIFLASPNNPTGNLAPVPQILELLDTRLLVVVDEAYYEFAGVSVAPLVSSHENLVVLRSFSKWAGLAGLRVGYGIMAPQIRDIMYRVKMPYNVTVAAQIAVRVSLADMGFMHGRIQSIVSERERLFGKLKEQGILDPIPSRANFVLCRVLKGEALQIRQGLAQRGIFIRYFDNPILKNMIRISVGKPEHTDALVEALAEVQ